MSFSLMKKGSDEQKNKNYGQVKKNIFRYFLLFVYLDKGWSCLCKHRDSACHRLARWLQRCPAVEKSNILHFKIFPLEIGWLCEEFSLQRQINNCVDSIYFVL